MKFKFSKKSGLQGREVKTLVDRIAFVPESDKGETEFIFAYRDEIPSATEEPDLYKGAKVEFVSPEEVHLRYEGLTSVVMLLTLNADDQFRREHPDLVEQNELFTVEEPFVSQRNATYWDWVVFNEGTFYFKSLRPGSHRKRGLDASSWPGRILRAMLDSPEKILSRQELIEAAGGAIRIGKFGAKIGRRIERDIQLRQAIEGLKWHFSVNHVPYEIIGSPKEGYKLEKKYT